MLGCSTQAVLMIDAGSYTGQPRNPPGLHANTHILRDLSGGGGENVSSLVIQRVKPDH